MPENKVIIIAEAGVNYNGSMECAFELIDVAADAGADIVKFQSFKADKLVRQDAPKADYQIANAGADESQYEMLKRLELSHDDHQKLIDHCHKRNITFLSTPFDVDGLHMLVDQFKATTIKLGSSELSNAPILLAAAQTGRNVILSTGMGTLDDIREALGVLAYGYQTNPKEPPSRESFKRAYQQPEAHKVLSEKIVILHCTTAYPTPYTDANLTAMQTIKQEFALPVGYSDHTMGIEVPIAAVAMGAQVIEKHFTLDRNLPGPDHAASLEPAELKAMVQSIRNVEAAIGDGKKEPTKSEQANMFMARKSIVAACAITEGETFTAENLAIKRPANGCSPMDYWEILGTKAQKPYKPDESIEEA